MSWRTQMLRAASVGLVGTVVQYLTLTIGVRYFGATPPVASAIGFLLGSLFNYTLNYLFTFQSSKSHLHAASRYYVVIGIGWVLNYALMALFTSHLPIHYLLAQVITTGICFMWHFTGSRLWAFRDHPPTV